MAKAPQKTPNGRAKGVETRATNGAKSTPADERIRARAYELFLARGDSNGDEVADWLRAEREIALARTAT